jgi:hypothetical protein
MPAVSLGRAGGRYAHIDEALWLGCASCICAGGPCAARLLAAKANPAKLPANEEQPNPPDGPIEVGAARYYKEKGYVK